MLLKDLEYTNSFLDKIVIVKIQSDLSEEFNHWVSKCENCSPINLYFNLVSQLWYNSYEVVKGNCDELDYFFCDYRIF